MLNSRQIFESVELKRREHSLVLSVHDGFASQTTRPSDNSKNDKTSNFFNLRRN